MSKNNTIDLKILEVLEKNKVKQADGLQLLDLLKQKFGLILKRQSLFFRRSIYRFAFWFSGISAAILGGLMLIILHLDNVKHQQILLLHQEMKNLRVEIKEDMKALRTEIKEDMKELRTEIKEDIKELRTEMKEDIKELREEHEKFRLEVNQKFVEVNQKFVEINQQLFEIKFLLEKKAK